MTDEELREAHRKHVESVGVYYKEIAGETRCMFTGMIPVLYKDFDQWKAETERQDLTRKREEERYDAGYSCEGCGSKDFTAHLIPYGIDLKCKQCGKIESKQW